MLCHFPSSDSIRQLKMAKEEGRRIWTRCPFCLCTTQKGPNHFDTVGNGCKQALADSARRRGRNIKTERNEVSQKMRDDAYAFTEHQSIERCIVEDIIETNGGGPEARAAVSSLLDLLGIRLTPTDKVRLSYATVCKSELPQSEVIIKHNH